MLLLGMDAFVSIDMLECGVQVVQGFHCIEREKNASYKPVALFHLFWSVYACALFHRSTFPNFRLTVLAI